MQLKKLMLALALMVPLAVALSACNESSQKQGSEVRENLMRRAVATVPVPEVDHFLSRQNIAKWIERQNVPDRPHYIYVFSDMGQVMGYYVAQSRPISTCTFMTPPVEPYDIGSSGYALGPAPGLDGVYYGQGGACDQWFFFDAETDALIELTGFKIFSSDQPLALDAEPIKVQQQ